MPIIGRAINAAPTRCTCCGAIIGEIDWIKEEWRVRTQYGFAILKSKEAVEIFDVLWRYRTKHGLTASRLIDIAYANDRDGGPEQSGLMMSIKRLRAQLTPLGLAINSGDTGGDGYQLIITTPEKAAAMIEARVQRFHPNRQSKIAAHSSSVPMNSATDASAAASVQTNRNMADTPG